METDRTDAHIFGAKTHFLPKTKEKLEKKSRKNIYDFFWPILVFLWTKTL